MKTLKQKQDTLKIFVFQLKRKFSGMNFVIQMSLNLNFYCLKIKLLENKQYFHLPKMF